MIKLIQTDKAPKAIGPYSQAVRAGQFLFISGMLSIEPSTGKLIGTNIQEQTRQVLHNLHMILDAQGLTFEQVVKSEVFLKNMGDFKEFNEVYAEKFSSHKPARQTVEVSALPMNALIEISCIAFFA